MENGDSQKFYGMYRGVVMKNKDPEGHRRIQVKIPQLGGDTVTQDWPWAWPSFNSGQRPYLPEVGEGVWIQFESGDPAYPIWTGSFGKNLKKNKHITINPLADTVVTTDIEDLLKIDRRPDGTKEIDLTTTVVNLSKEFFYGSFYHTASQTAQGALLLNTTDISKGVSITNSSRITFAYPGVYDIQFSSQFIKTDSGSDPVEIWLKKNGTNVEWSNTRLMLQGNNEEHIAAWNWFVNITAAGQYVEIFWYSPDTSVSLYSIGASNGRPGIPATIVTANKVR
jgi:hypothetical protein